MNTFQHRLCRLYHSFEVNEDEFLNNVLQTCREMLVDRGCRDITISETAHVDNTNPVVAGRAPDTAVYFVSEDRVGVKLLRNLIERKSHDVLIIVSLEGPTTCTKKESVNDNVQFFLYSELVMNVTRHKLVPSHERVREDEHPNACDYPRMFASDPIARYYDFRPGDVVKIMRSFGSNEAYPYFRCVV